MNNIKKKIDNSYGGIRFTADGFDCALPVTIDLYSKCSYGCKYCFSGNIFSHGKNFKTLNIEKIESLFNPNNDKFFYYKKALKFDRKKNNFPCPIQMGGLTDPCDEFERKYGLLKKVLKLAIKYDQPIRISTKGTILKELEYLKIISKKPHLFWIAFSIISGDSDKLKEIDKGTPSLEDRLHTMKILSKMGCYTSLRMRPIIPGISDFVKNKYVYKDLIDKVTENGASSISCEVIFIPAKSQESYKKLWKSLEKQIDINLKEKYLKYNFYTACIRPSYLWTEKIVFAIYKEVKRNGLNFGISDPTWKQLNDFGCCCGIPNNHPVFGNWQRENATNMLIEGKEGKEELHPKDYIPSWANFVRLDVLAGSFPAGPKGSYTHETIMWGDFLKENYNRLDKMRGCLYYFQGALLPNDKLDSDGNRIWKYKGLKREYLDNPDWKIIEK